MTLKSAAAQLSLRWPCHDPKAVPKIPFLLLKSNFKTPIPSAHTSGAMPTAWRAQDKQVQACTLHNSHTRIQPNTSDAHLIAATECCHVCPVSSAQPKQHNSRPGMMLAESGILPWPLDKSQSAPTVCPSLPADHQLLHEHILCIFPPAAAVRQMVHQCTERCMLSHTTKLPGASSI